MKTTITIIAFAVIALFAGCKKKCTQDVHTYSYSANVQDTDVSSTHFQDFVAALNFSVVENSNVDNVCDDTESTANLVIQNLTNETITFSYTANWNGASPWNTNGSVTIPPNGTVDKGVANHGTAGYAAGGFFTVTPGTITYQ